MTKFKNGGKRRTSTRPPPEGATGDYLPALASKRLSVTGQCRGGVEGTPSSRSEQPVGTGSFIPMR